MIHSTKLLITDYLKWKQILVLHNFQFYLQCLQVHNEDTKFKELSLFRYQMKGETW